MPSPHAQARHYVSLTQGTNPNIAGGTSGSLGGWDTPFGSLGGETGTDVCADMSCAALTIVRPLEIVVDAILTVRVDLAIEAPCLEAIRDVIIGLDWILRLWAKRERMGGRAVSGAHVGGWMGPHGGWVYDATACPEAAVAARFYQGYR